MTPERPALVLVRHGEAISNLDGRHTSHDDCGGLTDLGRVQAGLVGRALAVELAGSDVRVMCSKMPRSIQTASTIARRLGVEPTAQLCGLCERHAGSPEVADDEALAHERFFRRVALSLRRIVAELPDDGVTVCVTHGGVVAASLRLFAPGTTAVAAGYASLTRFAIDPVRGAVLISYNDTSHLDR